MVTTSLTKVQSQELTDISSFTTFQELFFLLTQQPIVPTVRLYPLLINPTQCDKLCTIAWLFYSAILLFTHGQKQQDPTSQDTLGVYVKTFPRSTCTDKIAKIAIYRAWSRRKTTRAWDLIVLAVISFSVSKKLSSKSLTDSSLFTPTNMIRAIPIICGFPLARHLHRSGVRQQERSSACLKANFTLTRNG